MEGAHEKVKELREADAFQNPVKLLESDPVKANAVFGAQVEAIMHMLELRAARTSAEGTNPGDEDVPLKLTAEIMQNDPTVHIRFANQVAGLEELLKAMPVTDITSAQ